MTKRAAPIDFAYCTQAPKRHTSMLVRSNTPACECGKCNNRWPSSMDTGNVWLLSECPHIYRCIREHLEPFDCVNTPLCHWYDIVGMSEHDYVREEFIRLMGDCTKGGDLDELSEVLGENTGRRGINKTNVLRVLQWEWDS